MNKSAAICNELMNEENTNYKLIRFAECCFEISDDGKADIMATLQSAQGAEKAGGIIYLQRYDGDWTTIKMWDKECKGGYITFYSTAELRDCEAYRVQVYLSVTKGGYTERLLVEETRKLDN